MKFFVELNEDVEFIQEEDANGKRRMYIEGVFLQSNVKNRNGRVYPKSILENEINRYTRTKINTNSAYGELGHPKSANINPDRISHRIVSLKENGNDFIGKAMISSTPMGEIAKGLMEDGGRLGVSSRGMASLVERNGAMYVQDDFVLRTAADIVIDPSAPDAYVNSLMEGVEWLDGNDLLDEEMLDRHRKGIKKAKSPVLEEEKIKAMREFINSLKA